MIEPRRWEGRSLRWLGFGLLPVLLVGGVVAVARPPVYPATGVIGHGQPILLPSARSLAVAAPTVGPLEAIDPALVVHRSAEIDPAFVVERSAEIDPKIVINRAPVHATEPSSFQDFVQSRHRIRGR